MQRFFWGGFRSEVVFTGVVGDLRRRRRKNWNQRRKQQNRRQGLKPLKLQTQGIIGFGNCRGDFGIEDDGGAGLVTDQRCGDRRNPGRAQEERIPAVCSAQGLASSGLGFGSA
ncbi:hypothetical protein U1Q18_034114 [Sarracenia purpurea var. burkii]